MLTTYTAELKIKKSAFRLNCRMGKINKSIKKCCYQLRGNKKHDLFQEEEWQPLSEGSATSASLRLLYTKPKGQAHARLHTVLRAHPQVLGVTLDVACAVPSTLVSTLRVAFMIPGNLLLQAPVKEA